MKLIPSVSVLVISFMIIAPHGLSESPLWTIGEFDRSYGDMALAGNYPGYAAGFPQDVSFVVGSSSSIQDWSYVQPGPADAWAGSREHPFKVTFVLSAPPTGDVVLRIALVDAQSIVPAQLRVQLNDASGVLQIKNGTQEGSLQDSSLGQPQELALGVGASALRPGENTLTLTATGSWILYDALGLFSALNEDNALPLVMAGSSTPFFVQREGQLRQIIRVLLRNVSSAGPATLRATLGTDTVEVPVPGDKVLGDLVLDIPVVPVEQPTQVLLELKCDKETLKTSVLMQPSRQWKIYVAASAHTDIGYTDLQPRVVERHNQNTDLAVDLCGKFQDFKWNCETSWQAESYLGSMPPERQALFLDLARQGRIGIMASYLNMLTGLCSHEGINRWLAYAGHLKKKYGIPFEMALSSDVPTQVWSIPTTLSAAGIKYFATGINTDRACTFTHLQSDRNFSLGQHLFWWEGVDGSKVLTYFSPGYGQGGALIRPDPTDFILGLLKRHEDLPNYPYDAIFMYGAFSDNCPLDERLAGSVAAWNKRYEYPKLILSRNAEFFSYIEKNFADKVPNIKGCGGTYWEDGAASSAQETAINRRSHELALAVDALHGVSGLLDSAPVPQQAIDQLWRNILFYDEHTWGAAGSVGDPTGVQTVEQWKIKAAFATEGQRQAQDLLKAGLDRLAGLVSTRSDSLLVFNPTSWERTDILSVSLPLGKVPVDPRTHDPLPSVVGPDGSLLKVGPIPCWGFQCYPLKEGTPEPLPEAQEIPSSDPTLENEFYRILFDRRTGGILSLIDKTDGRELVDPLSPYTLNGLVYAAGGGSQSSLVQKHYAPADLRTMTSTGASFSKRSLFGLGEQMIVRCRGPFMPEIETTVTLWTHVKRVDFLDRVTKDLTYEKEAVYFAFPFNAPRPTVRIEIPNGELRADLDMLPGGCRDWYCTQHWVRIENEAGAILWTSPDAPLLCLEDIFRGLWREKLELKSGHLFSYGMNNYWHTNYKAGQEGEFEFRYALTSGKAFSSSESARFGWQAAMPLGHAFISKDQEGPVRESSESFCTVEPENVFVTAIKAPETGPGVILRLIETAGQEGTALLRLPLLGKIEKAELCTLIEEPLSELEIKGKKIQVPFKGKAILTVRVVPES